VNSATMLKLVPIVLGVASGIVVTTISTAFWFGDLRHATESNTAAIQELREQRKEDAAVARQSRDALIELTASVKHMTRAYERSSRSRER